MPETLKLKIQKIIAHTKHKILKVITQTGHLNIMLFHRNTFFEYSFYIRTSLLLSFWLRNFVWINKTIYYNIFFLFWSLRPRRIVFAFILAAKFFLPMWKFLYNKLLLFSIYNIYCSVKWECSSVLGNRFPWSMAYSCK